MRHSVKSTAAHVESLSVSFFHSAYCANMTSFIKPEIHKMPHNAAEEGTRNGYAHIIWGRLGV